MLCGLADLGQVKLVDLVVEQVVDGVGESALKGSGRRQTRSQRNVSREHGVKTLDLTAALHSLTADTKDVACPLLLRLILFLQAKFNIFIIVNRESLDFPCAIDFDLGHDATVDRARENISSIVVSVLTDEVDTTRRGENFAFRAEESAEFLSDSGFHFHIM